MSRDDERWAAEPLDVTEEAATHEERVRLRLFARAAIYRIRRVRRQGGHAVLVENVRLPAALFPGLPKHGPVTNICDLAREYDLDLGEAIERISIGTAPESVVNIFYIPAGTPVLQLDRIVHLRDERPVEWRTAYSLDRDPLSKFR